MTIPNECQRPRTGSKVMFATGVAMEVVPEWKLRSSSDSKGHLAITTNNY